MPTAMSSPHGQKAKAIHVSTAPSTNEKMTARNSNKTVPMTHVSMIYNLAEPVNFGNREHATT